MPRPFKKGIACHGGMQTHPFSQLSFVALNNDTSQLPNLSTQHIVKISDHNTWWIGGIEVDGYWRWTTGKNENQFVKYITL